MQEVEEGVHNWLTQIELHLLFILATKQGKSTDCIIGSYLGGKNGIGGRNCVIRFAKSISGRE